MTDQDLLSEIQYALMEPTVDGGQSWDSEVWSHDEVLDTLNANLWGMLRDTHGIVTFAAPIALAPSALGVVPLPADWMATVALTWRDGTTNQRTTLRPADRFEGDLAAPSWQTTAGSPLAYDEQEADTLTVQLLPINATSGFVDLLYVQRPPALTGAGATVPVPDLLLTGIKYGTLGMLLRNVGRLLDPARGLYAQQRYELDVLVAKILLSGWA